MNQAEVIVIGGGPAGLCASISAARKLGKRASQVILMEANLLPGKKLLISGSGQCNFTNALPSDAFLGKLGKYANYLKAAYLNFDNRDFYHLLDDAGCHGFIREDLKVFPEDFKAETVLNALMEQFRRCGAKLLSSSPVFKLERLSEGNYVLDSRDGYQVSCKKLILATGGASYPQTGSDGSALKMAKVLGHKVIPFRPHLSPVRIADFTGYKRCAGITIPYANAHFITPNGKFEAVGDLLITHEGFSGPLIMDNSHLLQKGDFIVINWVEHADLLLIDLKKQIPKTNLLNALAISSVPRNLLATIMNELVVEHYSPLSTFSDKKLRDIGSKLMQMPYVIQQVGSFARAMASAGGVPLTEINSKTMQSRVHPGLYFAGEIMDYALPTGGFNIQIAASTGWMAGAHAASG